MITVAKLIAHLQTLPKNAPVAFQQFSDYSELKIEDISVEKLQRPRGDGYIGRARPDQPSITWVIFPGN